MKYIHKIVVLLFLSLWLGGCSEDSLDLSPKDELSEATAFVSYSNVKTYAWNLYYAFPAYDGGSRDDKEHEMKKDVEADLMQNNNISGNNWLMGNVKVPIASEFGWQRPYERIRRVNLMLDNLDASNMTQDEKDHWRSVGLFFRAYEYTHLISLYGAVPWVGYAITDADTDILYGPRTPRDEVAANILRDLTWAEAHINENGDGPNTVNVHVVRTLISRFGLFEGTWRKYHALGNHEIYLNASIAASEELMVAFPDLHPNYDELYNSESLADVEGIILYKEYQLDVMHIRMATDFRSSNSAWDITRKGIDKFLCKDGQTIYNSLTFDADNDRKDKYAEFRNRDKRLLFTTPPPYKIIGQGAFKWIHTENPADQEYFAVMEAMSDTLHKTLPDLNWAGKTIKEIPNLEEAGFNKSKATGYRIWKHYNQLHSGRSSADFADAPIFKMSEVLLNYAEAKFEMGEFSQTIADQTINKLRVRADVASMQVSQIDATFDPTSDTDVDPVLFEIRRERAVELMGEGYRRDDLRRWKKMNYASEVKLGRWINTSDYVKTYSIQGGGAVGYIKYVHAIPPTFPEYYYLKPLPSDQTVLNSQLEQNPGWE